jgi:hypothetical protein
VTESAPLVGAYVTAAPGTSDFQTPWDALDLAVGPLHLARSFDERIPAIAAAKHHTIAGVPHIYSLKPPTVSTPAGFVRDVRGFIAGRYTEAYQRLVASLPYGTRFTVWHEPENDMDGATFRALTERAVADLRMVVVDPRRVSYGVIALSYQYEHDSKDHTLTASGKLNPGWLDAAKLADWVGLDVYAGGPDDFLPISADPGAQRWLDLIVAEAGKPWGIAERGISNHAGESARAKMLMADWRHVCAGGADFLLLWNAQLKTVAYPLVGAKELAAFGRIVSQGRCR